MFKSGTQTTTAFAQANGINPLTFRSWLYVKTETTGFVKIKTPVRITEKKYKNPERRNWNPASCKYRISWTSEHSAGGTQLMRFNFSETKIYVRPGALNNILWTWEEKSCWTCFSIPLTVVKAYKWDSSKGSLTFYGRSYENL